MCEGKKNQTEPLSQFPVNVLMSFMSASQHEKINAFLLVFV